MKIPVLRILFSVFLVLIIYIGIFHIYYLDGVHGWFFSLTFEDSTVYAPGYSDAMFRKIRKGMSKEDVLKLLGSPIYEGWHYSDHANRAVGFENDKVVETHSWNYNSKKDGSSYSENAFQKIEKAMSKQDVLDILGLPLRESMGYSKKTKDTSYRIRSIDFKNEKVIRVFHKFYVD